MTTNDRYLGLLRRAFRPTDVPLHGSAALLFLRLVAGVAFMLHGWPKMQAPFTWMGPEAGIPGVFQALAALSELGGGLAWVLGLVTRLASLGLVSTMVVAVSVHAMKGDPFVGKGGPSYEPALSYLAVAGVLLALGPGKVSLDALLFRGRGDEAVEAR